MRLIILTLLFLTNTLAINAQNKIDQSSVNFKIKNIGTYAKGTFSESAISGNFSPTDLESSAIKVVIQVNSIDTGIVKRDKHLLEDDYFDAATYPTIEFSSTKIEKKSVTNYVLHGKLTIKKTTKTIQIPLITRDIGNSIEVKSNFDLSRKIYGVGGRSWILSDKVKAQVQFRVKKV